MKSSERCAQHPQEAYTHGAVKGSLAHRICERCVPVYEQAGWTVAPHVLRIAELAARGPGESKHAR
jgi:hypothetical protein